MVVMSTGVLPFVMEPAHGGLHAVGRRLGRASCAATREANTRTGGAGCVVRDVVAPPSESGQERKPTAAADAAADLDVRDAVTGYDDAPAPGVGEGEHPVGEGRRDLLLDGLLVLLGVDGQLAGRVLDADLDLHVGSFGLSWGGADGRWWRWRDGQCSSLSG